MIANSLRINTIIAAVTLFALIVAGCNNRQTPRRSFQPATVLPTVTRTLPPLPSRPLTPKLESARTRALEAAAAARELELKSEIKMTELSGWEYGTRTNEMAKVLGGDELSALSKLAAAGGMLPENTDLATLAASFTAASAGATYSPLDKQVLLLADQRRDGSLHPLLTHEFVHALQDQHFDLLGLLLARPYNFDRTEAAFAVVEGDAVNVQRRLEGGDAWTRRSLDDILRQEDEHFGEYRREVGELFPPLLTETFVFRYRDGVRLVESVRRSRGQRGVDDLFRRPPLSSEQVLHPEKYLTNEAPREASINETDFTAGGWRLVTSTPLGEIGVRGVLMAGMPVKDAVRAAAGWGGDRACLFERAGNLPLFVWKTTWDKREDSTEFFRAYNQMLSRRSGGGQTSRTPLSEANTLVTWREGGRVTLVERHGDGVIVVRGAASDVEAALDLARR